MDTRTIRVLSLCSGIGGLDVGLRYATGGAAQAVCFVEREGYCASVLAARMASGHLCPAPIWTDLETFDAGPWRGAVDCITAGWPCQPFSAAGKRKGKDDPRHLWPYIAEIIATIRPAFFFGENVPGHLTLGFDQVCEDLSAMGYRIEAGLFSAEECGAPHRRDRLFVFAHTDSPAVRHPKSANGQGGLPAESGDNGEQGNVADADGKGELQQGRIEPSLGRWAGDGGRHVAHANCVNGREGRPEPAIFGGRNSPAGGRRSGLAFARVDQLTDGPADLVDRHIASGWGLDWEDGVPRTTTVKEHRIDRLRALGNAVVPVVAAKAWTTLHAKAAAG